MDLASPALLVASVLAAVAITAWVAFRAGRSVEPPRATNEEILEMLAAIHRRIERLEKQVNFMPKDFAEEANASRMLIDSRLHEALDMISLRLPADDRPWGQRSRAAGA